MDKPAVYNKAIEVYLESAIVRGTLVTRHLRLSDHLEIPEEIFLLQDARLEYSQGKHPFVTSPSAILYKRQVIFVVDLSPVEAPDMADTGLLKVHREPHTVLIGAGPFWLRGDVHILPEVKLESFAVAKTHFIPMTNASLLDRPEAEPRTFLVNREKVHSLIT